MGVSAEEVITLAKNTKGLTKEQIARILKVAPQMGPADLEKLKAMILKVQTAEVADMKRELEVYKKAGAAYQEWQADKSRDALKTQEGAAKREDRAQAESLIQNI